MKIIIKELEPVTSINQNLDLSAFVQSAPDLEALNNVHVEGTIYKKIGEEIKFDKMTAYEVYREPEYNGVHLYMGASLSGYEITFPAVEKWLKGFYDAKFILTDSFHGMVFSIIFEKPFLVVLNKQRGATRFLSLLSALGLEDRLIEGIEDFNTNLLKRDIDYETIRKKLFALIDKSKAFLIDSLEK